MFTPGGYFMKWGTYALTLEAPGLCAKPVADRSSVRFDGKNQVKLGRTVGRGDFDPGQRRVKVLDQGLQAGGRGFDSQQILGAVAGRRFALQHDFVAGL